jgi:menaquinone-9 beta-reductase
VLAVSESFDALVIGGGPAGASAALLLASSGWRVGLVEKSAFPRRKVCGEFVSAANLPLLRRMGVAEAFQEMAGPEVREVGLFAGASILSAPMPAPGGAETGWGRALSREHLDTLLLSRALEHGVTVWQPWVAVEVQKFSNGYSCRIASRHECQSEEIRARILIAAYGSWEAQTPLGKSGRSRPRASDLFRVKAHWRDSDLRRNFMPLLSFPGGYGGMVHCDGGRTSLSCCVRRDRVENCRRRYPGSSAAEAVFRHIRDSCHGVEQALRHASLDGEWLSAGPIRPGIRGCGSDGIFFVGNAAGEAHPAIAEGISMAMQSAWLLCQQLTAQRGDAVSSATALAAARREYERLWKRSFVPRVRVSTLVANWAMRPAVVACVRPLLHCLPGLLTVGARASGKSSNSRFGA